MTSKLPAIERDAPVTAVEIENLRATVGWDRFENKYDRILKGSYTHFSVRERGQLVDFVNIISDGVGDAFLVDLMVHPEFQRKGIGRAIVAAAVEGLAADGIRCIQVTFNFQHQEFYRRCGFELFHGGIIDNEDPGRRKKVPAVSDGPRQPDEVTR